MLPGWLDITTLKLVMWIIIVAGIIVAIQSIRHVEKAMLRVYITGFIVVLCLTCYFYQKSLTSCKNTGRECTFLGYTVPSSGGVIGK